MEKNKYIYYIITLIVLGILIFAFGRSLSIKKVSINNVDSIIGDNTYSLFFSGDLTKEEKNKLKEIRDKDKIKLYQLTDNRETIVNYIKSKEEVTNIEGNIYIIFDAKGYLGYIDNTKDTDEYIKKFLYNKLPTSEIRYSTIAVNEYVNKYNSKDTTIAVFGEETCSYCERLQPVINKIAENKLYDINYFDIYKLSEEDYNTLMNMNIKIPASCNSAGQEKAMSEGFAKPMTLVSKKGKVIGCIKGYYDYDTYVSMLRKIMEG